jgi:hypothetical protein
MKNKKIKGLDVSFVSFGYLANLRKLKKNFSEGWAGVMKREGTHK